MKRIAKRAKLFGIVVPKLLQEFIVPWALYAVSLFNTILLLWLGLTILLNAEKRSWGTWMAGLGHLLGGAFFLAHTAALDYALENLLEAASVWWCVLAIPVMALPYGWFVLMLWYCGFWDAPGSRLRRRARPFLIGATSLGIILVYLLVWAAPLPNYSPFGGLTIGNENTFFGARAILIFYPLFLLLCTGGALDALAHPAPTGRLMSEEARRRARPWLFASSLVQLVASFAVAATLVFIVIRSFDTAIYNVYGQAGSWLDRLDLLVAAAVSVAVVIGGKAVVSYEIFTGKILPRRGFLRQWRTVVTLAAAYGAVVSLAWGLEMKPIYPLLLTTLLMSLFLAFFSFRDYGERERSVARLRPFVASQHLYERMLKGAENPETSMDEPFRALCEDILNASRAALIARGALAPLTGQTQTYPADLKVEPQWREIALQNRAEPPCASLDPASGMAWLVPLGDPQNPIGALLLGEKRDGGLYSFEEIEVARAAAERMLDTSAGAALAGRLMALQRQKVAEVQMLDRRARRVLHDDILPLLHTSLLALGATNAPPEALQSLTAAHRQISDLLREMPLAASPLARRGFVAALRHELESEMAGAFDQIEWQIEEGAEKCLDCLPPLTLDTLFYAAREVARNAAKYGRGEHSERELNLTIHLSCQSDLELAISDDGIGLEQATRAGSGHGLALHGTLLAIAGGQLILESAPDGGTRVGLKLPNGVD